MFSTGRMWPGRLVTVTPLHQVVFARNLDDFLTVLFLVWPDFFGRTPFVAVTAD
ncbi:hypothetical protein D3C84_1287030 [compost metagenome]